jgi:hypothetical protein
MKARDPLDDASYEIAALLAPFEPEERIRVSAAALCLADITVARKALRLVAGRRSRK